MTNVRKKSSRMTSRILACLPEGVDFPSVQTWEAWRRVRFGGISYSFLCLLLADCGWHHRLSGCEFEQTPGDDDGQGSLMDCPPWGCKESDTTDEHQGTTILFALSGTHQACPMSDPLYFVSLRPGKFLPQISTWFLSQFDQNSAQTSLF